MQLHRRAALLSPVQLSGATVTTTAGHRYTRRSRRPVDLDPGCLGAVTVSHLLAVQESGRVTRPSTAPALRTGAS